MLWEYFPPIIKKYKNRNKRKRKVKDKESYVEDDAWPR